MRILSASDAISPALARTQLLLFKPFRWGRSWKLAATAYLSFAGTIFFPFPLLYLTILPALSRTLGHAAVVGIVAAALIMTAVYVFIFWLCSHLQFAFFDIVLHRGEFVAPAWRKYGRVARRWTLVKCTVGLLATLVLTACFYPLVHQLVVQMMRMPQAVKDSGTSQMPSAQMFAFMAAFYSVYFGALFIFGLYYLLMSTATAFMLPSMALESVSPRIAFGRMIAFIRQQPGPFFGFVGLRVALGLAGYIAVIFAYEIVLLVLMLLFGLVCWLAYLLLHALHVPMPVLFGLGGLLAFVFFIGVNGYLLFLAIGTFFTFFEAHKLYFLGGRYSLLGDLLDRSTPPTPYTPL